MEESCDEGSEKQVVAAKKKLARSGRGRGHGRRWSSSSTDMDIETVTVTPTTAVVLGRTYSTAAVDGGGVKQRQQQAAREGEGEVVEQRPASWRRCGAGARLSRKIKEHRARFYVVRRCVAMLVCWRDADD